MAHGITARELMQGLAEARHRTRRMEWRDGDIDHAALLVTAGNGTDVHRISWRHGDVASRMGGSGTVDEALALVTRSQVLAVPDGATDPLGGVLPHHASAVVARLLPPAVPGGTISPRDAADAIATALCPTHGTLRDALGGDATELVATTGVAAGLALFHGDDARGRARRRAARLQPTFVRIMQESPDASLRASIDGEGDVEARLGPVILAWHPQPEGVHAPSPVALRKLRGTRIAEHGIDAVVYAMGTLPAEWLPSSEDDWVALHAVAAGYMASGFPASEARRMLSEGKQDWTRCLAKLGRIGGLGWRCALATAARLVSEIKATVVAPALAGMTGVNAATVRRVAFTLAMGEHGLHGAVDIGHGLDERNYLPGNGRSGVGHALTLCRGLFVPRYRHASLDLVRSLANPGTTSVDDIVGKGHRAEAPRHAVTPCPMAPVTSR